MLEEIFKKYEVDFDKLESFGFFKKDDFYEYEKNILKNNFKVILKINLEGNISGKVIDLSTMEEYTNIYVKNMVGEFVNQVKDSYQELLIEIRNYCFYRKYFKTNQANEITNYIIEKYSSYPEFLWEDSDDCAIFRNQKNQKWFLLITDLNQKKLGEEEKEIEIMNCKIDPKRRENLLKEKGFYLAYHMNKEKWITVSLDNIISIEKIKSLIDESYQLVETGKKE